MRRRQVLILILAFAGTISLRADEVVPKQLEFSRYDAMLKQSPFAVATAPMPAASAPSWSKDLFVANAAHTREVDLVTIMSLSDKNMKEYLSTEGPNKAGYAIANIQWSDSPGETKVTISRNGQFATLGFNEALMEQPQAGIPVPPPMVNSKPVYNMAPQPVQAVPTPPTPHKRGVIRNPTTSRGYAPKPVPPMGNEAPPVPPPSQ